MADEEKTNDHSFEEREGDLDKMLGVTPEVPESPPKVDPETLGEEKPAEEKPVEDKPEEQPELSTKDFQAELMRTFGTETPEQALKRASDQAKTVGKQGNELGEARTAIAGLEGQIKTLTDLIAAQKTSRDGAPLDTEGEVSEAPDPVLEPEKFQTWIKGLVSQGVRMVTPDAVHAAVEEATAPRDAQTFKDAIGSHDAQMVKKYGDIWEKMAVVRNELAVAMDAEFAQTGRVGKGKMSPTEGYHLMALGKSYLNLLKAGKINFVATGKVNTPKGGMGGGAGSGSPPAEPGEQSEDERAATEVKSWDQ